MSNELEQRGAAADGDGRAWWHFRHGADIGVAGRGATPAQAFEQAAIALTAVVTDPAMVACRQHIEVVCEAPALDLLFVDWLNELVYEMATRDLLFGRFHVKIDRDRLCAEAWGDPVDRARHQPAVEVKGATYTELAVEQDASGQWIARCVVDV
jgi:SHS2 domain-containing protein